jgi:hypothetical protein
MTIKEKAKTSRFISDDLVKRQCCKTISERARVAREQWVPLSAVADYDELKEHNAEVTKLLLWRNTQVAEANKIIAEHYDVAWKESGPNSVLNRLIAVLSGKSLTGGS